VDVTQVAAPQQMPCSHFGRPLFGTLIFRA
jgi:hypothetical protein